MSTQRQFTHRQNVVVTDQSLIFSPIDAKVVDWQQQSSGKMAYIVEFKEGPIKGRREKVNPQHLEAKRD